MTNWNEYRLLVMASLEELDGRVKKLEEGFVAIKLDMVKMVVKSSFWGSLSGVLVAAVPAIVYWYFHK